MAPFGDAHVFPFMQSILGGALNAIQNTEMPKQKYTRCVLHEIFVDTFHSTKDQSNYLMMANKARDVSWIVQKIRETLLGRKWNQSQLRHKWDMSSRSPPHPLIPDGPAHRLSANSYVSRDKRRLVTPPQDVVNAIHDGKRIETKVGQSLMSACLAAGIEIEAACDGNCACSTCHVYINEKDFHKLLPASEEEEDMLDLALFLQPTSRLSCQIIMKPDLEGLEFKRPSATRNFYADRSNNKSDDSKQDSR